MAFWMAVVVFFVVLIVFSLPLVAGTGQRGREILRRLEVIENARKRGQSSLDLELMRDELLSAVPLLHRLLLRWSAVGRLQRFLGQAGIGIKPGKLLLLMGVLALGTYVVVGWWSGFAPLGILAGVGAGVVPLGIVSIKRQRRLRAFEKHFPEAIDLLGRAVRSGHAFSTGVELVGKELPEPVAGEFRATFEEQNLGLPLREALFNLTERVPLIDVRFFVTALLIQKETGGNLGEILDKLSATIRERFKILGEVRIRTAQGRLTAVILMGLPPLVLLLLRNINPEYVRLLFEDIWGIYMLTAAVVLQVIGSVILWKIVHIEV